MLNNNLKNLYLSLAVALLFSATPQVPYAEQQGYRIHNLVSNMPGAAEQKDPDPDLVNAWGIAFNPDGVVWVNDNGSGKSTLYDGNGKKQGLVVTVPGLTNTEPSKPTGIVFFGGNNDFMVKDNPTDLNEKGAPSRFIFATEDGTIVGWAPTKGTQPPPSTKAIMALNNSGSGAIYKGLALNTDGNRYLLYATDFHNGKVDVFDGAFKPVTLDSTAFKDPKIKPGFAPFGIQAINGVVFVTYAKQDDPTNAHDDVHGPGLGYVNAYDASGHLLQRIAAGGKLNAPWGLAMAPANFGRFSNRLLVGNFGDGSVIAYNLIHNHHHNGSRLLKSNDTPIQIDGLWGLSFGNGLRNQPTNALFFTAGPNDEADGLYGKIEAVSMQNPNEDVQGRDGR